VAEALKILPINKIADIATVRAALFNIIGGLVNDDYYRKQGQITSTLPRKAISFDSSSLGEKQPTYHHMK
jgi:hypothetical protein